MNRRGFLGKALGGLAAAALAPFAGVAKAAGLAVPINSYECVGGVMFVRRRWILITNAKTPHGNGVYQLTITTTGGTDVHRP